MLSEIGRTVAQNQYIRFSEIPSLHMAGIIVSARDPRFSPVLILESNFDGTADEHSRTLDAKGRSGLEAVYSKCEGYPSKGARTDSMVEAYLREHSVTAAAFFVGLPGQSAASIRNAIAVHEENNRFLDSEGV